MSKSKVLFIMTGSIACYKACNVISKLIQNNFEVETVLTASAAKFIGAATIEGLTGRTPITDMYEAGNVMGHIHLIRAADLVIVAPATANYINKIANGGGDDLASTLFLAHDFKKPFLIAPAMNTSMYLHPATQASVAKLKSYGVEILEAASGVLACGEVGYGKLLDPDLIFQEIQKHVGQTKTPQATVDRSQAKKVLITSGGTSEPIDAVRFITNSSTGQTGVLVADQLFELGFDVTLINAKNAVKPKSPLTVINYTDYQSLHETIKQKVSNESYDVVIQMAAVSDYSVESIQSGGAGSTAAKADRNAKISSEDNLVLNLKKNPKIIPQIKQWSHSKDLRVVGFKLTSTTNATEQKAAADKVLAGGADIVVQNDMNDIKEGVRRFKIHSVKNVSESLNTQELIAYLADQIQKGVPL